MVSARGGTLPAHGQSELHLAVITGRAHEVTKLLKRPDRKRIIDAQDDDGTTPLMAAVLAGRLRIVKLILKAGASMRIRDRRGLNPRHYNRPSLFARKLELYRRLGMPPATSKQRKERLGILKLLRFPAALESW
jgi:ankyrin repeat protein